MRELTERAEQAEAALTALQQERDRLSTAIEWALGERGEFGEEPPPLAGLYRRRFWWRQELRTRAFGEGVSSHAEIQSDGQGTAHARAHESSAYLHRLTEALRTMQREKHDQATGRAMMSTDYHHESDFEHCACCRAALAGTDGAT